MNAWNMNILITLHENMSLDLEFPWTTWRNGEPKFIFFTSSSCSFLLHIFLNTLFTPPWMYQHLKVTKTLFYCSVLVLPQCHLLLIFIAFFHRLEAKLTSCGLAGNLRPPHSYFYCKNALSSKHPINRLNPFTDWWIIRLSLPMRSLQELKMLRKTMKAILVPSAQVFFPKMFTLSMFF